MGTSRGGAGWSNSQSARSFRVLVVEDHAPTRRMLTTFIELSGHRCEVAHDAREALAALARAATDVVLIDIGLPGANGHQLAREIRHSFGADIRLVATTGSGRESEPVRARAAGFDALLTKPVDLERLLSEITAGSG